MITSLSNPKIKDAVKLRDGTYRRRTKTFIIDGLREIDRAVRSGIRIDELFILENALTEDVLSAYRQLNIPLCTVNEPVMRRISFGDRNEGAVAVAEEPPRSLQDFEAALFRNEKTRPIILAVLENVEKPGNIGAVFRSADGAGVDGVILAYSGADFAGGADVYHPNAIRSGLGTVFCLPSVTLDSPTALSWLRQHNIALALAKCNGAVCYTDFDYRQATAIVLGSEAFGLTDIWDDGHAVALPMHGIADSLNISVAAGVLFYEAQRQRSKKLQ